MLKSTCQVSGYGIILAVNLRNICNTIQMFKNKCKNEYFQVLAVCIKYLGLSDGYEYYNHFVTAICQMNFVHHSYVLV